MSATVNENGKKNRRKWKNGKIKFSSLTLLSLVAGPLFHSYCSDSFHANAHDTIDYMKQPSLIHQDQEMSSVGSEF